MQANEVKKLKWVPVSDWGELTMTDYTCFGETVFVGKSDVEGFVENIFRDVARKLNIPYAELEPILKEENAAFYSTMNRIFRQLGGVAKALPALIELEKLLRIPDVTTIPEHTGNSTVDEFFIAFSALSDREKLEILQRLGKVSIKVELLTD